MAGLVFLWSQGVFVWSGPNRSRTFYVEFESRTFYVPES